jgi:hypothetical protein
LNRHQELLDQIVLALNPLFGWGRRRGFSMSAEKALSYAHQRHLSPLS